MNASRASFLLLAWLVAALALPPADAAAQCSSLVPNQIRLAKDRVSQDDYTGALRVLNATLRNCDQADVRDEIASVIADWYRYVIRRRSPRDLATFLSTVSSQDLRAQDGGRVSGYLTNVTSRLLSVYVGGEDYSSAHRICRGYSSIARRTFAMRYYCGRSAKEVQAYSAAIEAFRYMLDNWDEDQTYITWDETATSLQTLYLRTTRFSEGFELSKRLVLREVTIPNMHTSLIAARGKFLVPFAEMGGTLFDGVASDKSIGHTKTEIERITFPSFVQSIYIMSQEGNPEARFHGADMALPPNPDLLAMGSGNVFLIRSTDDDIEDAPVTYGADNVAWLVSPIDAGYFIVQFDVSTNVEENILLDELAANIQSEPNWRALYEYEYSTLFSVLGGTVATVLGSAYLDDASLQPYRDVFDRLKYLLYYSIQDEQGDLKRSYSFRRSRLSYASDVWDRSTQTKALFHHELELDGTPLREVVWPVYEENEWLGVIRVGLTKDYQSTTN